jgi:hypothetical protein
MVKANQRRAVARPMVRHDLLDRRPHRRDYCRLLRETLILSLFAPV